MSPNDSRSAALAALLAVTLLSPSVVGVALADSPSTPAAQTTNRTDAADEEAVVDAFIERIETLETVEFTRTTETEYDGRTTTTTRRVVADVDDFQKRVEIVGSARGGNITRVVNETTVVAYNADESSVTTYEHRSDRLLPRLELLTNESAVDYEYEGTDVVGGTEVYVLTAEPTRQQAATVNTSLTVAVDTETHFPVRTTTTYESANYSISLTQTYENVTINAEIPDSTFELDVPEDTSEPSFEGPEITTYDDYDALESNAALSIPDAELPGGYEFGSARTLDGDDYSTVMLTYTDGEDQIHVSTQADSPFDWSKADDYEKVRVGNTTGYYTEVDDYAFLHVDTADQSYTLYGKTDRDELIDIAAVVVES